MNNHNKNINYIFILFIAVLLFVNPKFNYSQDKYGFNFDGNWIWEDLINKVVIINPALIKSVDHLKNKISIYDARILLKNLSVLDSLKYIRNLQSVAGLDSQQTNLKWDSLLTALLDSIRVTEDFSGLLTAANKLSDIRTANFKNEFDFSDRAYLPHPEKSFSKKIDIKFNYDIADKVLKYFDGDTLTVNEVAENLSYKVIPDEWSDPETDRINLVNNLKRSFKEDSLGSIYKWLNPASYRNMGGVSVYKNNFANFINTLRKNEINIKFDIEKHLSGYLSDSISSNVEILFLFGRENPGLLSGKNMLGISLEYFGDDYNHLKRFIQHETYKIALKEVQLPVETFIVNKSDKEFINILSSVLENGTANYVGPVGTETRPWYLLEKDFKLFNNTFKNIYKPNNKQVSDSLTQIGFLGDAPFITMATQMAYIIETTLGRNSLNDAIKKGPVFFFNSYIKAYKEYPEKIRKVFRFGRKLEDKISDLKLLFPNEILSNALKLKRYINDSAKLNEHVGSFLPADNSDEYFILKNLLAGQLFLEAGSYKKAKDLFLKGVAGQLPSSGNHAGDLGDLFLKNNAEQEALSYYDLYVEESPKDALAYYKRGRYFYKTGQDEKARNDFEKALVIDSGYKNAKTYLLKVTKK